MTGRDRPLAIALSLALLAGTAGVAVAVSKHRPHAAATGVRTVSVDSTYSGGLVTLSPGGSDAPTPYPQAPIPAATGIDLLWRSRAGDDQAMMLEAVDWSGQVRGRLALPAPRGELGISASPDGQRLLIQRSSGYEILSAQGQISGTQLVDADYTWADDSRHLCEVVTDDAAHPTAEAFYVAPDASQRRVAAWAWEGGGGITVAACSASRDLMVLQLGQGDDSAGHVTEYRVIRLSTGAVLRDVHPPQPVFADNGVRDTPGALATVSASLDGRLLALEPYNGDSRIADAGMESIVDTVSGRVLGHVKGPVAAFSGDDRLALTWTGVVDWQSGRTLWRPRYGDGGGAATPRPGSADVLVSDLSAPPTPVPSGSAGDTSSAVPPSLWYVLHADGSATQVACCGVTFL